MVVYRVIRDVYSYGRNGKMRNEFLDYQQGIISFPTKTYNHGLNTHDYKHNITYLHFFHFYESALKYTSGMPMSWDGRYFIALYNIPKGLLDQYRGFGLYPESNVPFLEYAIPFSELNDRFIQGKTIQYNSERNYECSKEYKKYIEGNYECYLENIKEIDKQLIKSFIRRK